jgi:hypothetical protein
LKRPASASAVDGDFLLSLWPGIHAAGNASVRDLHNQVLRGYP